MAWLLLLSAIIYYTFETQAVGIHAPPDPENHLQHLEKNNSNFLDNKSQSRWPLAENCMESQICERSVYPVSGKEFYRSGPLSSRPFTYLSKAVGDPQQEVGLQ